jgi:hypothetical protein
MFFVFLPHRAQRCTAGTQPPPSYCPVLSVVVVVVGGTGGVHGLMYLMDGFGALKNLALRLPAIAGRPTPSVHGSQEVNNKLNQSRGENTASKKPIESKR